MTTPDHPDTALTAPPAAVAGRRTPLALGLALLAGAGGLALALAPAGGPALLAALAGAGLGLAVGVGVGVAVGPQLVRGGRGLWRRWRGDDAAPSPATAAPGALDGMRQLDERMLQQLSRATALSETSALQMIERVTGLRGLSARLMAYLQTAQSQSTTMQVEIERNGHIVGELAGFVQQLPQQIAQERQYLDQLVGEVRQLSGITETIRGMARQTEILSINAAIAAAQAGEAGRGFSVLAGEVRRLALQSNQSAQEIDQHIRRLVDTVQARSGGQAAQRLQRNEDEAARLLALTSKLDEGYLDMRQFYAMLLTAITEHNSALDAGITSLLDTAQYQDVYKQIVDRLEPALDERHQVLSALIGRLRRGERRTPEQDAQALALVERYMQTESLHRDPEAAADAQPGEPGLRIELF